MKETLDSLTLAEFVSLVCGDDSVLLGAHEIGNPPRLEKARRDIISEYQTIADPAGASRYISHLTQQTRNNAAAMVFGMCANLVTLGHPADAREVMEAYGINTRRIPDDRLAADLHMRRAKALDALKRMEQASGDVAERTPRQIRADFDAQTAAIMAHFRFQIDPATIRAGVYANLVARYSRDIKAMMARQLAR